MKVLLLSAEGDGVPIAHLMSQQGDKVDVFIKEPKAKIIGDGLIHKVELTNIDPESIGAYDLVFADMVGMGATADKLRDSGFSVFGASRLTDKLELDREYGQTMMKASRIKTPPSTTFNSYDEGKKFVRENKDKRFVYKPCGNQAVTHTYVSRGWEDLLRMFDVFSVEDHPPFILQEAVEGIEISTELWWNGKEVVNVNHTMEDKRFFPGGLGPQTGCMGNVVWMGNTSSRLYREGIGRIVKVLSKSSYRGPVDLNTIVTSDKLFGLEFTARLGYDAIFAFLEITRPRVAQFFRDVAIGRKPHLKPLSEFALTVRVSVPPYPNKGSTRRGTPILGINSEVLKHVWLSDVIFKDGAYQLAGYDGVALVVAARGSSSEYGLVKEARRRAYRTVQSLYVPDAQYRQDVGYRVETELPQLRQWGWL